MTVSLVPIPRWTFNDKNGKPLIFGKMYSYDNDNRALTKPIYRDPAGVFPYTQPVIFDSDGGQGPFYFEEDGAYFLQVFDRFGIPQFSIENYAAGSGGGGTVTLIQPLENIFENGQYFFNQGAIGPAITETTYLAPNGLQSLWFLDALQTNTFIPQGVYLFKSNTVVTDALNFISTDPGDNSAEMTPLWYFNYQCSNVNAGGETFKYIIWPIKNAHSLEQQSVTFSLAARSVSLSQIELSLLQNFGTGGSPDPQVITDLATFTLTANFARYNVTTVIPSTGGVTSGTCANSFMALLIKLPLNATCNIDHTNVQGLVTTTQAPYQYQSPSFLNSMNAGFRTGDIKCSFNLTETGWIPMNNGTIGADGSGATIRANRDTFNLYALLWINVSNTYAPVAGGRGANPSADFAAGKVMTIPAALGRAMSMYGNSGLPNDTTHVIGSTFGEAAHVQTLAELAAHTHSYNNNANGANNIGSGSSFPIPDITTIQTGPAGSSSPMNVIQPTLYVNYLIKL